MAMASPAGPPQISNNNDLGWQTNPEEAGSSLGDENALANLSTPSSPVDVREALLPCPFCGSEATVRTYESESLWSHNQVVHTQVGCEDCEYQRSTEPGYEPEALDWWNIRAAPTTPAPPIKGDEREALKPFAELADWIDANRPEYADSRMEVQIEGWPYTLGVGQLYAARDALRHRTDTADAGEDEASDAALEREKNSNALWSQHQAATLTAAIDQNDRMRHELAHVGNLVSDLERAMRVDPAADDGSWPGLAWRIGKLIDAAADTADAGEVERLLTALAKVMPVQIHNTADYAEVYFAEHSTQAMTMNPRDWEEISDAFTALTPSPEARETK